MANSDLPLDDLATFLAVVEAAGFRAAGKRLGRAPSTISETVRRLEARVGTPLLIRSTRAVRPTEAGRELAERLHPVMAEARAALEGAATAGGTVRGPLRLNVPKAVMADILPPLIDRLVARHPEVTVELLVEDSFVDTIAVGCHAGIRYDEALEPNVIAVPIGPARQRAAVAAAPSYLARRGVPLHPDALGDHEAVLIRFSGGAIAHWELERGDETVTLTPPAAVTVSAAAAEAAIGFAVSGRGLIQIFRDWLQPHFETGALVPVLEPWWPEFDGPRLYFPDRRMPPPLRAFVDLVAEARRDRESRTPLPTRG